MLKTLIILLLFIFAPAVYSRYEMGFRSSAPLNTNGQNTKTVHFIDGDYTYSKQALDYEKTRVNVAFDIPINADYYFFEVPELFHTYKYETYKLRVGRKILNWNYCDSIFEKGILNSRKNFSLFSLSQTGLTGLHNTIDFQPWEFSVFASYIAIPEVFPRTTIEDGKVKCEAPNCKSFLRYVDFESKADSKVIYQEYDKDIPGLLFRPTIGSSLNFNSKLLEINAFYINKPENRIRIYGEGVIRQSDKNAVATLGHEKLRHHVYGADLKYLFYKSNLILSYINSIPQKRDLSLSGHHYLVLREYPSKEEFLYLGTETNLQNLTITAGTLFGSVEKMPSNVYAGDMQYYQYTPSWKNAYLLKIKTKWMSKLYSAFNATCSKRFKDLVFDANMEYLLNNKTKIQLGAKLIGSTQDNSYWWEYRAEDKIFTRLIYGL